MNLDVKKIIGMDAFGFFWILKPCPMPWVWHPKNTPGFCLAVTVGPRPCPSAGATYRDDVCQNFACCIMHIHFMFFICIYYYIFILLMYGMYMIATNYYLFVFYYCYYYHHYYYYFRMMCAKWVSSMVFKYFRRSFSELVC